ncbi:MAG: hypothetical protein HY654_14010 [Acidobacteria bacterium]|nr:hypothetical protein [Acidobacteriota bacterium]
MRASSVLRSCWRRRFSRAALVTVFSLVSTAPALADATLFVGANATPATRPVRGFAGGVSLLVLGFEFEYASTVEDPLEAAPALKTYMGNVLVMTPTSTQLYATLGGGFFRETLGTVQETNIGINLGVGIKIGLAGPLRIRVDYRIFALRGTALHPKPQRVYAGVNLAF